MLRPGHGNVTIRSHCFPKRSHLHVSIEQNPIRVPQSNDGRGFKKVFLESFERLTSCEATTAVAGCFRKVDYHIKNDMTMIGDRYHLTATCYFDTICVTEGLFYDRLEVEIFSRRFRGLNLY